MLFKEREQKVWTTPQLTVYGNVETITQDTCKQIGGSDGFYLQSVGSIGACS